MTVQNKIITVLGWLIGNFIYFITYLIPKKKNLWVFGSWFGEKYCDNSKYLFEYVCKNQPEIRPVWLTNNIMALKLVRSKGFEACKSYSLKGTWISMRARVGVISTWYGDLNRYTVSNMLIVQLWHGTPLKKIERDDNISAKYKSAFQRYFYKLFPFLVKDFAKAMMSVPSPHVQKILSAAFGIPLNNVKVAGYPRNDIFFMKKIEEFPIKNKIQKLRTDFKIGIFLPTHRGKGKNSITSILGDNLEWINSRLKALNVILLLKYHYYQLQFSKESWTYYSNIIILSDDDINQDIYPILTLTDFLITDYSSIMFDYLLTDKPMIFAPFDMDDYLKNDREFYYHYDDVTPGAKTANWDELIECIDEVIKYPAKYNKQRAEIREKFNQFVDGNSCERVFREIINNA